MQTWPRPAVPSLAGAPSAAPVSVFDTARDAVVPVGPTQGAARLYVCGITPYDATHLGHAFTYLTFDLLQRQWLDAGLEVVYAQNVTDVDDPLLERATATGRDWEELAAEQTQLFRDDMAALRILPPQHYLGVVESLDTVVALIRDLRDKGLVYAVDDPEYPDLYFRTAQAPGFGAVSGLDREAMLPIFAARGGDPDRPGKEDPFDCLLWRLARPGEPSWEAGELGAGRPGWHVECTAIALGFLGAHFDVQGGGSDLAFPHHEMCAAEATSLTAEPFADAYVHVAMVGLDGEKMSKSRGNLVFVSRLRQAGVDPMAIRLALLAHHHRTDWMWTDADLAQAQERLARWRAAVARSSAGPAQPVVDALRAALRHDLDSPAGLAVVDAWASTPGDDAAAPGEVAAAVDALLGVALA